VFVPAGAVQNGASKVAMIRPVGKVMSAMPWIEGSTLSISSVPVMADPEWAVAQLVSANR
jgi:hypothetical protein